MSGELHDLGHHECLDVKQGVLQPRGSGRQGERAKVPRMASLREAVVIRYTEHCSVLRSRDELVRFLGAVNRCRELECECP
jgi:hypothetical protein